MMWSLKRGGIVQREVEIEAQIHLEEGMYWAEVPAHPGLFASGETLDELAEALAEAWFLYHEDSHTEVRVISADEAATMRRSSGRVDQLKLLVPA